MHSCYICLTCDVRGMEHGQLACSTSRNLGLGTATSFPVTWDIGWTQDPERPCGGVRVCTPCTLYCTGARRLGAQIVPSEDVRGANENAMRATFEPVRCADAMVIRGVTYGRSRPHPAPYTPCAGLCAFSVPTAVQSPAAHGQRTALRLGRISELDLRVSVVSRSVPHSEPNEIQNGDEGPSRAELHETTDSTSRRTKTALVLLRSCGVGLFRHPPPGLLASWPPGHTAVRSMEAPGARGRARH